MQHFINVSNRRMQVSVIASVYGGIQVETVRAYPAAGVVKGQTFTVAHDLIERVTGRQARNVKRSKAFKARMRKQAKAGMPLESPESHSETLSAVPSGNPSKCPVCASEHATGSCTMTNVLEGK